MAFVCGEYEPCGASLRVCELNSKRSLYHSMMFNRLARVQPFNSLAQLPPFHNADIRGLSTAEADWMSLPEITVREHARTVLVCCC